MLFYFELLGQSINNIFKINNSPFNFVIGFFFILSMGYLSSGILQFNNVDFDKILIINLIILVFGLVIIFLNLKKIKINFKIYELVSLLSLAIFSLYFSYQTTLGDLHGFDSTFYINLVVGPLNTQNGLFSFSNTFGYIDNALAANSTYRFQTYYGFCSSVLFILKLLTGLLNKNVFLSSAYIWIFQILFTFSLISVLLNCLRNFSKKQFGLYFPIIAVFVLCYLKIYYNNVYGFYGNSFRAIAISYVCYYATKYNEDGNKNNRYLISLSLIAGCAFTSSFLFFTYIYLFGYVLVNFKNDENIFKWMALTVFVPTINLLMLRGIPLNKSVLASFVISVVLFFGNKYLRKILNTKYIIYLVVFIAFALMFYLSYRVTNNVFDFSAFFDSGSESSDMTLNYFRLESFKYYKLYMLFALFGSMILAPKEKNNMIAWILIIILFNPFCCSFFKNINPVYYRTYDVILNPYLLIYYCETIYNKIGAKYSNIIGVIVFIMLLVTTTAFKPLYYHGSFAPKDNYDYVNKMQKTESDIIKEIDGFAKTYNLANPYICSPSILTFSSLGYGRYIYAREYWVPWHGEDVVQVHKIFRPVDYYGEDYFIPSEYGGAYDFEPDYRNAYVHLKNAGVDMLVVSKDMDYYDEEKDVYYSIRNLVEWWYEYPDYENEDYCLYMINRK